jgi:hypothetical protein
MAAGRRGERDQQGRFVEKQSPLARRVEVWLEPDFIALLDRHCAPLKEGRGRLIQRLLQQLLKDGMEPNHLAPGRSLVRINAQGLQPSTEVMTADQDGHVLTTGPEPWLEWTSLEGWNLLMRPQPLELAAASLLDLVAVAEPALMSAGFDTEDPEVAALIAACAEAQALALDQVATDDDDEDLEFLPWDGTPQSAKLSSSDVAATAAGLSHQQS